MTDVADGVFAACAGVALLGFSRFAVGEVHCDSSRPRSSALRRYGSVAGFAGALALVLWEVHPLPFALRAVAAWQSVLFILFIFGVYQHATLDAAARIEGAANLERAQSSRLFLVLLAGLMLVAFGTCVAASTLMIRNDQMRWNAMATLAIAAICAVMCTSFVIVGRRLVNILQSAQRHLQSADGVTNLSWARESVQRAERVIRRVRRLVLLSTLLTTILCAVVVASKLPLLASREPSVATVDCEKWLVLPGLLVSLYIVARASYGQVAPNARSSYPTAGGGSGAVGPSSEGRQRRGNLKPLTPSSQARFVAGGAIPATAYTRLGGEDGGGGLASLSGIAAPRAEVQVQVLPIAT
jgi:hypothetical protein